MVGNVLQPHVSRTHASPRRAKEAAASALASSDCSERGPERLPQELVDLRRSAVRASGDSQALLIWGQEIEGGYKRSMSVGSVRPFGEASRNGRRNVELDRRRGLGILGP